LPGGPSVYAGVRHFPCGSGSTIYTLEDFVFSGHVATREPSTWWDRVLFTTRLDTRMGTVPSHCSKGYSCFRVPTVAPGPTSGEDTSLQVGPKPGWRLVRRFRALADVITASPPSITPTATFVPAPPTHDGFAGPCAGCFDTVALVLKIHLLCPLRRPRGGAVLARAAVQLLCTQEPVPKEDDSWARAPTSETEPLV
jgi:hypothetical protein